MVFIQNGLIDQITVYEPCVHIKDACFFCFWQGSGNVVLQRAADGTPLQWFVAHDSEIISQV